MRKALIASAALAVLFAVPAAAADIPLKAPPRPAPIFTWTGCYIGANAGWAGSRNKYVLSPDGSYRTATGAAAPPNAAGSGDFVQNLAALTHDYHVHGSSGLAGGQVGCNYQYGALVLGAEADWQWTGVKNSVNAAFPAFPDVGNPAFTTASHIEQVSSKLRWLSTFRGRIGYASDRWMVYATGGVAVGDVRSDTNVAFATFPASPVYNGAIHTGTDSVTRAGWVAGGGVEYAFWDNWSLKAEYLYVSLRSFTYGSPLIAATAPAVVGPGYSWITTVHERENIVRLGLNYRFGFPYY